ncbi:hypothetical protein ACJX0J_019169, partial [Zea mays]
IWPKRRQQIEGNILELPTFQYHELVIPHNQLYNSTEELIAMLVLLSNLWVWRSSATFPSLFNNLFLVKNTCVEYLPKNYNVSHLSYIYTLTHPNNNIQEVGLGHHWDDEINETHAGMRAPLSITSHIDQWLVQSVAAIVVAGM